MSLTFKKVQDVEFPEVKPNQSELDDLDCMIGNEEDVKIDCVTTNCGNCYFSLGVFKALQNVSDK